MLLLLLCFFRKFIMTFLMFVLSIRDVLDLISLIVWDYELSLPPAEAV